MYNIPSSRKQVESMKKNSGLVVIGGILWLSFVLAGAGVVAVDYATDESPTAIAQTPSPVLVER